MEIQAFRFLAFIDTVPYILQVISLPLHTYPLLISTDFLKYPLELKKNQLVYTEIDPKKTSDRPDKLE